MKREDIIKEFTEKIKDFQKLALNIAGAQDAEDLFQECSLMLLEFPEDRLISYYNPTQGLKPFFIRMLINQYKSRTSKFHKKYRKQEQFIQAQGADVVYNEGCKDLEAPEIDRMEIKGIENYMHILQAKINPDKQISMFGSDLELKVWETYVDKGSLRKALAALPEDIANLFDLKKVHEIVKKYRKTIKQNLQAA